MGGFEPFGRFAIDSSHFYSKTHTTSIIDSRRGIFVSVIILDKQQHGVGHYSVIISVTRNHL